MLNNKSTIYSSNFYQGELVLHHKLSHSQYVKETGLLVTNVLQENGLQQFPRCPKRRRSEVCGSINSDMAGVNSSSCFHEKALLSCQACTPTGHFQWVFLGSHSADRLVASGHRLLSGCRDDVADRETSHSKLSRGHPVCVYVFVCMCEYVWAPPTRSSQNKNTGASGAPPSHQRVHPPLRRSRS